MLEDLSSRFELVVEGLSGVGGRIDLLRGEMVEQFVEVGKQIRFLSQQIGENRDSLSELRAELTAEMVRLGEALGAARVEFRQQLASAQDVLRHEIVDGAQRAVFEVREEIAVGIGSARKEIPEEVAASRARPRKCCAPRSPNFAAGCKPRWRGCTTACARR